MTKIITTITTVFDTDTQKVEVYKDVVEHLDKTEIDGVTENIMALKPGQRYIDSTCKKCDTKIAVRTEFYLAGGNYCHACAMAKLAEPSVLKVFGEVY